MKFKLKNTLRYEFMVKKNIKKVEIEIAEERYQINTEYSLEKGTYNVNVHIEYMDGTKDAFLNKEMVIKKNTVKIDLYAKTIFKLFQNLFVNKYIALIFIILMVLVAIMPSLLIIASLIGTYIILAIGNDYVLKKYGFEQTVRVKFK